MLEQGLTIMLVGMSMVFIFLIILVLLMILSAKVISALSKTPDTLSEKTTPHDFQIVALLSALAYHKQNSKRAD
jgi:sodium pump decarboxylase gamma subunit